MEVMTANQLLDVETGAALAAEIAELFPQGQLPRGRTIGCGVGTADDAHRRSLPASSRLAQGWWLAWTLSRQLMVEGAWAVAVDAPDIGVEAAAALGVPIERVVRVETGRRDPTRWADAVVAAADGFDLVITQPPARAERLWRKVQQRIHARRIVVFTLGAEPVATDFDIELVTGRWVGIGDGHGHLAARRTTIRLGGRRMPGARTVDLWLPDATGALATPAVQPLVAQSHVAQSHVAQSHVERPGAGSLLQQVG